MNCQNDRMNFYIDRMKYETDVKCESDESLIDEEDLALVFDQMLKEEEEEKQSRYASMKPLNRCFFEAEFFVKIINNK